MDHVPEEVSHRPRTFESTPLTSTFAYRPDITPLAMLCLYPVPTMRLFRPIPPCINGKTSSERPFDVYRGKGGWTASKSIRPWPSCPLSIRSCE